jgi:hypothetical protein
MEETGRERRRKEAIEEGSERNRMKEKGKTFRSKEKKENLFFY